MKPIFILTLLIAAATSSWIFAQADEPLQGDAVEMQSLTQADLMLLYHQVENARGDLAVILRKAGVGKEGREGRGEHVGRGNGEGRGEHAGRGNREGRGEHAGRGNREGRGEHAGRGNREGRGAHGGEGREEGGRRLKRNESWDATRNGAHLVLAYDQASQSFKGQVRNDTRDTIKDVRVEVHLSNGQELGPTRRVDLDPGQSIRVELSAAGQRFTWWTTHPEHGSEEGHGPNHEESSGEHGEKEGQRPQNPHLRPLHNQLKLLQRELHMLRVVAERRSHD